jgi:hypothetical protein
MDEVGKMSLAAFAAESDHRSAFDLMPVERRMVGGEDACDVHPGEETNKAYEQLVQLAEAQRAAAPFLSTAQAFERAFKANPQLARKAHRRPEPTTSFPFPR